MQLRGETIAHDQIPLDSTAFDAEFLTQIYDQLRRLAQDYLRRERPGHTLQATALVHEAYLKLREQERVRHLDRTHFFAVAAQIMRHILVDHARKRRALKRGGPAPKIDLEDALISPCADTNSLVALDEALRSLEKLERRQGRVVELRFFGGLSTDQIAAVLHVSPKTVKRDWRVARVWLHAELSRGHR